MSGPQLFPRKLKCLADRRFAVSGLSAAHTVYLNGGNVLVLDKQSKSLSFPHRWPLALDRLSPSISADCAASRLLRRQFHQGHVRYQRRSHAHPDGSGHPRQCQAVLRGYSQVRPRQGSSRADQGPHLQVCLGRRMAARRLQPGPDSGVPSGVSSFHSLHFVSRGAFADVGGDCAAQRPLLPPYAPWP